MILLAEIKYWQSTQPMNPFRYGKEQFKKNIFINWNLKRKQTSLCNFPNIRISLIWKFASPSSVLNCKYFYFILLYYIELLWTALHCTALHCTALTALPWNELHSTTLLPVLKLSNTNCVIQADTKWQKKLTTRFTLQHTVKCCTWCCLLYNCVQSVYFSHSC